SVPGMGGMGSMGGMGDMRGMGGMENPGDPQMEKPPAWIQQGFHGLGRFHYITDGFARFSDLLMMNTGAIHGSFSSFVGLIDGNFFFAYFSCVSPKFCASTLSSSLLFSRFYFVELMDGNFFGVFLSCY